MIVATTGIMKIKYNYFSIYKEMVALEMHRLYFFHDDGLNLQST